MMRKGRQQKKGAVARPLGIPASIRNAVYNAAAPMLKHPRLSMSRWQLLHTDARMRDVAEDVGYTDYSYFGRLFKRAFGVTPEECRLHRELGEMNNAAGK